MRACVLRSLQMATAQKNIFLSKHLFVEEYKKFFLENSCDFSANGIVIIILEMRLRLKDAGKAQMCVPGQF